MEPEAVGGGAPKPASHRKRNAAVFAIVAQPFAAHRAENMGVSRETYLRRQRIWAVVGAIIAVAIVAFATWYNLDLRPTLDTWA